MKPKSIAPYLSAAVLCLASAHAAGLTLDQAMSEASGHSREIKILKLETESSRWGEKKAFAGYLPKLQAQGRHLFTERFEEIPIEFGGRQLDLPAQQPYTTLTFTATLEVFSGFQTVTDVDAARLAREASEHRFARAEEQLRTQVRALFNRALGAQILVDVANENIKTLESHISDVAVRIRSGVSTRFDSLRAEVQLEDARTEKVAAENNVVITRAALFEALGVADDGKSLDGKLPDDFGKYENLNFKLSDAKREDRKAQALAVEELQSRERSAQAHWYPRVSLFGAETLYNPYNRSIWEEDERFKPSYSVGVALTWNLFDGGASVASQKQAAIAEQIAAEKLARLDQHVPVELDEAQRRVSYDLVNYKAKLRSVHKAEEAVRLARSGLRAGTRTNIEVLDAVVDFNRARAASVRSQIEAVEDIGRLELALGRPL